MHIIVTDLDKQTSTFIKQVSCDRKAVTQIGHVRMNTVFPCISKSFDNLWFPRNVCDIAVHNPPICC